MPGADLVGPAHDRAAELADLGRAVGILEIVAESGDVLASDVGVDIVDAPHSLLGMPRRTDRAVWVTGVEKAQQLRAALLVEAFVDLGQQPRGPIQRVVSATSMTQIMVSNARRHGPDRSNTGHRTWSHHASPMTVSH